MLKSQWALNIAGMQLQFFLKLSTLFNAQHLNVLTKIFIDKLLECHLNSHNTLTK